MLAAVDRATPDSAPRPLAAHTAENTPRPVQLTVEAPAEVQTAAETALLLHATVDSPAALQTLALIAVPTHVADPDPAIVASAVPLGDWRQTSPNSSTPNGEPNISG